MPHNIANASQIIRKKVQSSSAQAVGRSLGISRATIATYLAGVARPASAERIERRAQELGWIPTPKRMTGMDRGDR